MNIVQLTAENIKRLSAVTITPEGHIITVGGKNGAGKSSVLDSIAYALGGKALIPEHPIRRGQTDGKVVVDLGQFIVTRTFKKAGDATESALKITNKEGAAYPSPQAMLDKLLGQLTFDPLEFAGLKPVQQRDVLKGLVNLDTTLLDEQYKDAFVTRTHRNKEAARLGAISAAMPFHQDAPMEEIPLATISQKIREAEDYRQQVLNAEKEEQRLAREVDSHGRALNEKVERRTQLQEELRRLEKVIDGHAQDLAIAADTLKTQQDAVATLRAGMPDLEAVRAELDTVEQANRKVRANQAREKANAEANAALGAAKEIADKLKEIADAKALVLQQVTYPVAGLAITDGGVTFNDLPLEQASTAEQLRVSVAIGLALNPKLKVLLVRNGNMLDSASMALVSKMAEDAGAQIWMERVAESADGVSVMIEEGHVAPVAEPVA